MLNPMTQMLNQSRMIGGNSMMSKLAMVKQIMQSGDPSQIVQAEMQRNPQFAAFVNSHKNQSAEELLAGSGIDVNALKSLMK